MYAGACKRAWSHLVVFTRSWRFVEIGRGTKNRRPVLPPPRAAMVCMNRTESYAHIRTRAAHGMYAGVCERA